MRTFAGPPTYSVPAHDSSGGTDGRVSLEISPLLAYDTQRTVAQAKELYAQAARFNLFVKIPGTREGVPGIEQAIFEGIPINVTLLLSCAQYVESAEVYLRGLERRLEASKDVSVRLVASLFVSRWDKAVADRVPPALQNQLGIAVARRTYQAYRDLLESER